MTDRPNGPDLLTLAMRRAHAETAEWREQEAEAPPEPPRDGVMPDLNQGETE